MSILKKNFSPKGITLSALLQKNSANPWNHWSHDRLTLLFRTPDWIADEVPVALVYNGISHAVMMATPSLLEEFALGFSLTEGIINTPKDIYSIQVTEGCRGGKNVDVTIAAGCFWHLKERRRSLIGRTGCGLCGVESLSQAVHTAPAVPDTQRFSLAHYQKAIAAVSSKTPKSTASSRRSLVRSRHDAFTPCQVM